MAPERSPRRPSPVVKAYIRPYDYTHDRYSAYYREGLRRQVAAAGGRYDEIAMGRQPELLRVVRRIRDAYRLRPVFERAAWLPEAIDHAAQRIEGPLRSPGGEFLPGCSQYLITAPDGREIKVCVDALDSGEHVNAKLLAWSDVYFKTNYWPTEPYPSRVVPMVNGDPLVIPQIDAFRAQRALPKRHDVAMVVRVWGGADEVEGVEHNLRLIEAVARARCTKFLYAYLVAGDVAAATRRLERQGIACGTAPLPASKLWRATAESRLNIIRLGMHYCIPWRVTGALAIGSGIVLDRAPFSRWPEPLTEGVHFLTLGTETGVGQPLAKDEEYAAIPHKIEAWLADRDLAARLGRNNGEYYDRFAAPGPVGEHILRTVSDRSGEARPSTQPLSG